MEIHGPSTVSVGTKVQLMCSVLEGRPAPGIRIVTPSNMIISQSKFTFTATLNKTGNYLCVANMSTVNATSIHYLYVYGKQYKSICMKCTILLCYSTRDLCFVYYDYRILH